MCNRMGETTIANVVPIVANGVLFPFHLLVETKETCGPTKLFHFFNLPPINEKIIYENLLSV